MIRICIKANTHASEMKNQAGPALLPDIDWYSHPLEVLPRFRDQQLQLQLAVDLDLFLS